jgi:hypothetical protein
MVEEYTDGSMAIWCQEKKMKFRQIAIKPEKPLNQRLMPKMRRPTIPSPQHPWKRLMILPKKVKKSVA